jgi:hypothetical protein
MFSDFKSQKKNDSIKIGQAPTKSKKKQSKNAAGKVQKESRNQKNHSGTRVEIL